MHIEKPQYLYRGIKLNYDLLNQIQFFGVDIKPYYEPIIDSQGRSTVTDGNEYGVYMTDNLTMVQNAYARVSMDDGLTLRKDLGRMFPPLKIPSVGIVYEIETEGLDVHKPWLADYLNGHYNNGFEGDEWVVESIPADKYHVMEATIGPDWLHEAEKVDVSDMQKAETFIKDTVETRKQRLELLGQELAKLSPFKRMHLTIPDRELYRDLFGPSGACYVDIANSTPYTGKEYAQYLMAVCFQGSRDDLDYKALNYIKSLSGRLKDSDGSDRLVEIIKDDIALNSNKRNMFVQRKLDEGESFTTNVFDSKEKLCNDLLSVIGHKVNGLQMKSSGNARGQDGYVTSIDNLIAGADLRSKESASGEKTGIDRDIEKE